MEKISICGRQGAPLTEAAAVDSPAPENKQYNRMPFELMLTIDQRYIDRLLVAFRNSPLPMEVQEVRINPQSGGGGGVGIGGRPVMAGARLTSKIAQRQWKYMASCIWSSRWI